MMSSACGKGSGQAKVQLSNKTSTAATTARVLNNASIDIPAGGTVVIPTVFQMKILQAYLSEDIDANQNNSGAVERIWVNPDCTDINNCSDDKVGYFDLIDPATANAKLNSQVQSVTVGTYRYVRVEFCIGGAKGNNVKFKTADMSAESEVTYDGCGVTSAKMDPPVELKDGETVTIALDYDLSEGPLYYMTDGGCTATTPCVSNISLVPRIVK